MKKFALFLFLLFSFQISFAQNLEDLNPVSQKINDLKKSGVSFSQTNVFSPVTTDLSQKNELSGVISDASILQLDAGLNSGIIKNKPAHISLSIPQYEKADLVLELTQVNILAPGFIVKTDVSNGQAIDAETGLHYRGIVRGDDVSLAAISFYRGEISGLIITDEGNTVLGKLGNHATSEHILYNDNNLLISRESECAMQDDGLPYFPEQLQDVPNKNTGDCVKIYIEVNKDIYQDKGAGTTAYITGVFNQSALIYANVNIEISISEMLIITSGNPYPQNNSSALLGKFQQLRGGGFNGDLGHLVSYKGGGGIAAGFSGLCNSNPAQSLCFSGIDPSYNTVPTYSWTVMVFTHEMGHLFGSRHTHACVWNGNNTAIDGCYTTEGSCSSPGIPSNGGTIMSYCHLQSVGINFNNYWGTQPGNVIKNSVANASCLSSSCGGVDPTCNDGIQNQGEEGIDCGGPCAPCPTPTCSDGIQNQGETGVDCGGPCDACPPSGCDTPSGLFASNIKPKRAKLNWDAVAGAIDYTVELRIAGGAWTQGTTTNTNIQATGLSNGSIYEWHVRANCSGGSSPDSGDCTFIAGNSGSGACGSNTAALISGNEVTVFPNPVSSLLNVEINLIDATDHVIIQILDIHGKTIMIHKLVNNTNLVEFDMSRFASGIYLVRVDNGVSVIATRFVKQ